MDSKTLPRTKHASLFLILKYRREAAGKELILEENIFLMLCAGSCCFSQGTFLRQTERQIYRRIPLSCSDPSRAWTAIWTEILVQVCWFMSWWVWHFWIQLFRSSTTSKLGKNKHQMLTDASGCPWRNLLPKQIISHSLEMSGVGHLGHVKEK